MALFKAKHASNPVLRTELLDQCSAMLRYVLAWGLGTPVMTSELEGALEDHRPGSPGPRSAVVPLSSLLELHDQLSKRVAPAMPLTICLLDNDVSSGLVRSMFGPVANVRHLMFACMGFTVCFVLVSLSSFIGDAQLAKSIYQSDGIELLTVLIFLLSAAGLGGCFHALFTAQRYIAIGSYNPRHDTSYWIRIGLGLISGLMLAVIIPVDGFGPSSPSIAKPLLAVLGGFSSGLVYRVLQRLVDTVESLFHGDPREGAAASEHIHRTTTAQENTQTRLATAADLLVLRDEIAKGTPPERLNQVLSSILEELLPSNHAKQDSAAHRRPDAPPREAPAAAAPAAEAPPPEDSEPEAPAQEVPAAKANGRTPWHWK